MTFPVQYLIVYLLTEYSDELRDRSQLRQDWPDPEGGVLGMDGWRRSEPRSAMVRLILFHTRTTNQAIKTLIKPLKTVDEVMALDAATPDPSKKEESTEAI